MGPNTLKIMAGDIVSQSKLSKHAKLQLLNWLQNEATEVQIKAMLLDGEPFTEIDDQAAEIINKRFSKSNLNEGGWKTLAGFILIGPVYWAAYRALRAAFDEKSKQCGIFGIGRKRDVCLWKLRAEKYRKEAALFSKVAKDCGQSKDPAKCKASVAEKVAKSNAKAKELEEKIRQYAVKSPEKHAKAKAGLEYAKKKQTQYT